MGKSPKLIKVRLHDRNEDSESVWAYDLGPARKKGARRVKIANICFLHAKPTLHDIIVVEPDPEDPSYILQWDQRGVPWRKIGTRIAKDGGRFAMIVDYRHRGTSNWRSLVEAISRPELAIEGAWGPEARRPGRAYLAIAEGTPVSRVMTWLADNGVGYTFTQIHPTPRKKATSQKSKKPASKKAASQKTKKPASKKATSQKTKKPASKKPASQKTKKATSQKTKKPASKKASKKPASKKPASKRKPAKRR
jgi:hypothetical protein